MALVVVRIKKERDLTEKVLLENQERYRSIIAASNTGAWEYHADTNYQWCSPEYFEMLGYEPASIGKDGIWDIQQIWINLLHPDDKQEAIEKFNNYLKSGSTGLYEGHFRMKHKNGEWLWILSRGQTLRNADGSASHITLGTHINLTEKKQLEIELLLHNQKLLKYAFLTAHEVRGPLARLLGLIEVSKLDAHVDYPWFFEKIKHEAQSMDEILHTITRELNDIKDRKPE
ncbi:MAG TPA: PAS domain-containing protein [Ohtaekwangia sp.]